ncbi:hypothetical protein SMKI_13G3280 [Saccharomyces mikatae IFO 1815]|uniref:YMR206W-like protein n=1 Tax=Saccharomyces mikatae IFO 1815 TaxID=226126 RepID=A0AA35IRQ3_SACMI|nr:uncharacterized protein SMKI_13G3280 [Saccharomyces mikatae IFO 1815]CAI4035677.1 hypothetical protein SMKI_13G3280 [Saccharomyces mikatae IFO 1815]
MLSTSSNRPISAHLTIHYKPIQEEEENEMRSGTRGGKHHDDYLPERNRSPTPNKKHEFIRTVLNINDNDSGLSESCSPRKELPNGGAGNADLLGDFISKRQQRLSNSMNIYDLYQCVHNLSPNSNNHQFIARRFSESHIPSLHHRQQQQSTRAKNFVQSPKDIQRIASYAADSDQRVMYLPNYHQSAPSTALSVAEQRAAKPRKLPNNDSTEKYILQLELSSCGSQPISPKTQSEFRPSCSSSNCSSSSSSSVSSSVSVSDPNNITAYETHNVRPQFPNDQPLDISSPCTRHHHRRNSIAVKFDKALYKKTTR